MGNPAPAKSLPDDGTVMHCDNAEVTRQMSTKGEAPLMRSKVDDLGILESARQYKFVSLIAMVAAFSASLDGYRETTPMGGPKMLET